MRLKDVGRTSNVSANCMAKTRSGKRCSRAATTSLGEIDLCEQHAANYEKPELGHCSARSWPDRPLTLLHFSDLHGNRKATAASTAVCDGASEDAVVVITGDVGSTKHPALDRGWSSIPQSERWVAPGNHDRDPKKVFGTASDWVWQCPWVRILGPFALIGFVSGPGSTETLARIDVDLALRALGAEWTCRDKKALVIASHHELRGPVQARLSTGLEKIMSAKVPIIFLQGHEHGEGSWTERPMGRYRSWQSRVTSCDRNPVGHLITVANEIPSMTPL